MRTSKVQTVIAAAVLGLGTLAVSAPAWADNSGTIKSGCSINTTQPPFTSSVSGTGKVVNWQGSGSCSKANKFGARLVHNNTNFPDGRVAEINSYGGPNFSAAGYRCDGGGTTQYYGENVLYYTDGSSAQRVTKTVTLTHC